MPKKNNKQQPRAVCEESPGDAGLPFLQRDQPPYPDRTGFLGNLGEENLPLQELRPSGAPQPWLQDRREVEVHARMREEPQPSGAPQSWLHSRRAEEDLAPSHGELQTYGAPQPWLQELRPSGAPPPGLQELRAPGAPQPWLHDLRVEEDHTRIREDQARLQQQRIFAENARKAHRENPVHRAEVTIRQDGLIEAFEAADGTWVVEVDGEIVQCNGSHFCPHCWKHLSEYNFQAHVESALHKKRIAWHRGSVADGAIESGTMDGASFLNGATGAAHGAVAGGQNSELSHDDATWSGWSPSDPWVEQDGASGYWKCLACNKHIDDRHIQSDLHQRRVQEYLQHLQGYPEPEEEFQVWMPCENSIEKWLRCLLCGRWVQDDYSHGLDEAHASKEHAKNLHHYRTRSAWYVETVLPLKRKYGGKVQDAPAPVQLASSAVRHDQSAQPPDALPPPPKAQPPWNPAWSEEHSQYYFWNTETKQVQWEPPVPSVQYVQ